MAKSGFARTLRGFVFGASFAAALAAGCDDNNQNPNPPLPNTTGAGGFVQCVIIGPAFDGGPITVGSGGINGITGAAGAAGTSGNMAACPNSGGGVGGATGGATGTGTGGAGTGSGGAHTGPGPY
jgi:hypothetical protein